MMTTSHRIGLLIALAFAGPAFGQSVQIKDANGVVQTIRAPNANGRAAAAASGPVALSTEDLTTVNSLFKPGQLIGNTAFGISGTLPGFATAPTFNLGTAPTLNVTGTFFQPTQPVSGSVGLIGSLPGFATTPTFNVGTAPPVTGTVSVSNLPTTQAVSGTVSVSNFPAGGAVTPTGAAGTPNAAVVTVQGVSGGTGLRVDGSAVTQPVSGIVSVSNFPAGGAVTPTAAAGSPNAAVVTVQGIAGGVGLRVDGSGVTQPISGTVGVSGTVPVSGTFYQTTQPVSNTAEGTKLDQIHTDLTATPPANLPPSDPTDQARSTAITTAVNAVTTKLGTAPAQDATVSGVTTAVNAVTTKLGTAPAQDATVAATNTALGSLLAKQSNINADAGSQVHVQNFPTSQTVTGTVGMNGSAGVSLQQASTANGLIITGAVADGVVPTTFSHGVSGIDGGGLKRTLLTDTAGRLQIGSITSGTLGAAAGTSGAQEAGRDAAGVLRAFSTDATGALTPPQAPSSGITETVTAVAANTSTTIAAASATAIAVEIQCDGASPVGFSRKGSPLTSIATAPGVMPQTAYQLYVMPIATTSAITAWTATAQTCRVTQYARQ